MSWTYFDLGVVNQSNLESTMGLPSDNAMELVGGPGSTDMLANMGGSSMIQRRRHTFVESISASGQSTPRHHNDQHLKNDSSQIGSYTDETYRERLAESLRHRLHPGILPSMTFLDFCVQAYFTYFHSLSPIIHGPTLKPSNVNAVLLLSICSIRSLFLGSPRALALYIAVAERRVLGSRPLG
ncbi:hypothetical protein BJY01DRAFT_59221 [Aspergillus pseudoustus]|uniref:Transcription factor domain-containing protein n=1 Tax=Aspergillus pseudoustus TaxID=1810923 RepID=A0ABR4J8D0_9EURO